MNFWKKWVGPKNTGKRPTDASNCKTVHNGDWTINPQSSKCPSEISEQHPSAILKVPGSLSYLKLRSKLKELYCIPWLFFCKSSHSSPNDQGLLLAPDSNSQRCFDPPSADPQDVLRTQWAARARIIGALGLRLKRNLVALS